MRRISTALAAVSTLLLAGGGPTPVTAAAPPPARSGSLTMADVARLSAGATQPSIIILRNQHRELPARGATATARTRTLDGEQAALRSELSQVHAPSVRSFHVVIKYLAKHKHSEE